MVRRADAGDYRRYDRVSAITKSEALADIICGGGNESAATVCSHGNASELRGSHVLANTVKPFAFTRCGKLNVFGMVDAQIAVLESELLS